MVSSASARGIATKYRLGRVSEAAQAAEGLAALPPQARMDELPITIDHALDAHSLPGQHRDPFDRILIAQAQCERIPVVTFDPVFETYNVDVVG